VRIIWWITSVSPQSTRRTTKERGEEGTTALEGKEKVVIISFIEIL